MSGLNLGPYAPRLLSVLRIMTGLLFIQHGLVKMFGFPTGTPPVPLMGMSGVAGILELVGGALIIIGLFTRCTAFVLSGLMAFAYFIAHAPGGFYPIINHGELAIMFCFVFLYIAAAGPGPWSIDAQRGRAATN